MYTYFTLVGHPFNDIYPLGDVDLNCMVDVNTEIVYVSSDLPFLISRTESTYKFHLLRFHKEMIANEALNLDSLNPDMRDEFYGRHVSNDPYLLCQEIFEMTSAAKFTSIELMSTASADELLVLLQSQDMIQIVRMDVSKTSQFPGGDTISEIAPISGV